MVLPPGTPGSISGLPSFKQSSSAIGGTAGGGSISGNFTVGGGKVATNLTIALGLTAIGVFALWLISQK